MLTKLHHSAIDGVSGIEMLGALLDSTPSARRETPPPAVPATTAGEDPSDVELLARAVVSLPRQPVRMVRGLPRDTAPHRPAADHAHPALRRPDLRGRRSGAHRHPQPRRPRPAAHPPDRRQGVLRREDLPHRRFAFGSLSLPTIKAIKNEMPGATVNDVVVAVCAGALRRRMLARGDAVDTALVAMVPVSVRTAHEHYGNQISSMIVAIPSHEPHPRARLEHAHEAMRSAKELHRGIPAQLLREANHTVPPALFTRTARMISTTAAIGWIAPPFNVTISSIPGSPTPLYCAGARVVSQHPVNVLIDGLGLSLTLLSYEDHLDFGLTADRALVPDVWHLETDMRAELDTLAKEFGVENA
ncbi:MAG TPA: WS/DGAT domain-containing protein [Aldersonia sp.]